MNEVVSMNAANPSKGLREGGGRLMFEGASLTISAERLRSCSMRDLVDIIEMAIAVRNTIWAARDRPHFSDEKDEFTPGGKVVDEMADWFEGLIDTIQECVRAAKPRTSEEAKMKTFALLTYLTPLLDDLHEVSIITATGLREISDLEFRERGRR